MGCGVACLAMITGESYEKVRRTFSFDAAINGLTAEHLIHYLSRHGFWINTLRFFEGCLPRDNRYVMVTEIMQRILMIEQLSGRYHFVAVQAGNIVHDPADRSIKCASVYKIIKEICIIKPELRLAK